MSFKNPFFCITFFHDHGSILRLSISRTKIYIFSSTTNNLNSRHREKWVAKVWVAQWAERVEEHWTSELPIVVTIHNFCPDGIQSRKTIGKLVTGSHPVTDIWIYRLKLFTPGLFCFVPLPLGQFPSPRDQLTELLQSGVQPLAWDRAVSRDQKNSEMIQEMFLEDKEWRKERNNVSVEFYMTSRMCLHSCQCLEVIPDPHNLFLIRSLSSQLICPHLWRCRTPPHSTVGCWAHEGLKVIIIIFPKLRIRNKLKHPNITDMLG